MKIFTPNTIITSADMNLNFAELSPLIAEIGWTTIGQPGFPAFASNWVNFNESTHPKASYYKDAFGIVHLKGIVKSGSVGDLTTCKMFTLPVGYRPLRTAHFPCASNGTIGIFEVWSSGLVGLTIGSNAWVSLSGISFKAEQ